MLTGYHLSEETREKLMFLEKIWAELEAPKENYQSESDVMDRTSYKGPGDALFKLTTLKKNHSTNTNIFKSNQPKPL